MAEQSLADLFAREGFAPVDPPILQPLAPFLDYSGEDVRRRMYVTTDPSGQAFCLRPDFTIPVALEHLKTGDRSGRASYVGPVFRHRPDSTEQSEFTQAGVEWYGDDDPDSADAAIVTLAVEAVALAGIDAPAIRIGDIGLSAAFLDALALPAIWRRRLWRQQGRHEDLATFFERVASTPAADASAYPALASLLANGQSADATRVLEDVLSMAGVEAVGGRGPHQIATRFVEKALLSAGGGLAPEKRRALSSFSGICEAHDTALMAVEDLAGSLGMDLTAALDRCRARGRKLADAGLDLDAITFDCGFVRPLDYYTGVIFDLRAPDDSDGGKLIGGGRYDALLGLLGATPPQSAVGFSLWTGRVFARSAP